MAGLVIKQLPENLHRRLKEQAARNHRSMTKEVIALLERGLELEEEIKELPAPYQGRFRLTDDFVDRAKREGRE